MITQAVRVCRVSLVSIALGVPVCYLIPVTSPAATLEECTAAYRAGDYAKGIPFFTSRAENGDAMAQFCLGLMYMTHGLGVTQDYAEAAKWYRKAAEQGNASGQNALGVLYADGTGVPRDPAEAARWYRQAADQGHSMAQYNLGVLYREGYGVAKDEAEAAMWFQKSAEQGNDAGRDALLRLRPTRRQ